jgi:leucyl-tRNA synthetase
MSVISAEAEYGEGLIRDLMSDIAEVRKIVDIEPTKVAVFTTPAWKRAVMEKARDMQAAGTLTVPDLIKACMADDAIKSNGKAASEMAKKVAVDFSRSAPGSKDAVLSTDEYALLHSAEQFLSDETGLEVRVYSADAEGIPDPNNKARQAAPGRPAISLE